MRYTQENGKYYESAGSPVGQAFEGSAAASGGISAGTRRVCRGRFLAPCGGRLAMRPDLSLLPDQRLWSVLDTRWGCAGVGGTDIKRRYQLYASGQKHGCNRVASSYPRMPGPDKPPHGHPDTGRLPFAAGTPQRSVGEALHILSAVPAAGDTVVG